jgi:EAL domain-containing protein (putative c-di-GMP-specific phosphodiesterase class I)/GGDEF domain-containing protein/ActR/RegA family two-component response regulator
MDNPAIHLQTVNRVLAMTSRVSRAATRSSSPDSLYLEVTRIAVECGLFSHASLGLVDPTSNAFRHFASWGKALPFRSAEDAGVKLIQRVCAGMQAATYEEPGGDYRAVIGLPLQDSGQMRGVLLLQVDCADFVEAPVVRLLSDIADDVSYALVHMEIDQRRLAAETKLHYLAFYNSQTGLPSASMLGERLTRAAEEIDGTGEALVLLDIKLQRTDQVLQLLGNAGMDELLREVAARLEHSHGVETFAAQLAPDEFALLAVRPQGMDEALELANQVHASLARAIRIGESEVFVQSNIGGAVYPHHEPEVRYLLRRARAAAEPHGNEFGVRLYTADLDRDLEKRMRMAADLHRALERDEFLLYYQPQLNLKTGRVVGVEALMRWQHPQRGMVAPGIFIPLLEQSGLMPAVGTWALRSACAAARNWHDKGFPWLRVAVNMSAQQFRMHNLVALVRGALLETGLPAEYLELELTESLILESAEKTIHTMRQLKQLGVSLSLDDFGTGYSSLSYLRHYPVDRIKIDQSFIRDMTQHPGSAALVRSILAMAGNLGLSVIAEGVETLSQYGYLRKQLCDEMQGYLFSRPIPEAELTTLLQEGKRLDAFGDEGHVNTVLLVDDEPLVLSAMRRAFHQESWKFLTASSGAEAFELLAVHDVGVIISDQRMPGMTGTAFLHRAKEMYPDAIRILLTGHADYATVIGAVNDGDLYKVLSKPIDDKAMRDNIREALRRHEVFLENRRLSTRLAAVDKPQ